MGVSVTQVECTCKKPVKFLVSELCMLSMDLPIL
jgi:hypothetical protein